MGLRGTVPPAGADLHGAGADHLPFPEAEGDTRGRGDGALIFEEYKEFKEFERARAIEK